MARPTPFGFEHRSATPQALSADVSAWRPYPRSVPEELRRHSLGDDEGKEYSTNLDRNRYGSDDQYLSTVIRYDLEFLGLCPALVDVEIIDAKSRDAPLLISAGPAGCKCRGGAHGTWS